MLRILFFICSIPLWSAAQSWKIAEVPLTTPWAKDVSPSNVLPEYPRPQMVRKEWQNLNGLWEFEAWKPQQQLPRNRKLDSQILVPFAWESALSGVRKQMPEKRAWYKRNFSIPPSWKAQRILLHFGAVDWETTVYINGVSVGTHRGGYDAFSFDITDQLVPGSNELIVQVYDPANDAGIAAGKQENSKFADPNRYFYSPVSGIWQTVWLEPVPSGSIRDYHIKADALNESVSVSVNLSASPAKKQFRVEVLSGSNRVAAYEADAANTITFNLRGAHLWTPDDPFLYDIKISLLENEKVVDEVAGYFGMRSIAIKRYRELQRIALNDSFFFSIGPLDQGYWPDGLYTAPTDEALRWDVENIKRWGFNMVRKHIKVEPARWYYWCDKLGLMVWQDMPCSMKQRTEEEKTQWETELQQMIKQHWNAPSLVNWVVFNEHWGIYDVERITKMVMALDETRLVTGNTGIDAGKPDVDYEVGHIKSNHHYRPPTIPLGSYNRAIVNGEFGAIGYNVPGHVWDTDGPWVHNNYAGYDSATAEYQRFFAQLKNYAAEGLSAAVYTQWTDLENEMNGLYTYDRRIKKLDQEKVTAANKLLYSRDWMKEKYPPSAPVILKVNTGPGY